VKASKAGENSKAGDHPRTGKERKDGVFRQKEIRVTGSRGGQQITQLEGLARGKRVVVGKGNLLALNLYISRSGKVGQSRKETTDQRPSE